MLSRKDTHCKAKCKRKRRSNLLRRFYYCNSKKYQYQQILHYFRNPIREKQKNAPSVRMGRRKEEEEKLTSPIPFGRLRCKGLRGGD